MAATLKLNEFGARLDSVETRVKILEDDMREVKTDLKAVRIDVAEIKGTLNGMPTAAAFADLKGTVGELKTAVDELRGLPAAFGELKGRVDSLPTMAKMNSAIGLATAVIVILNNWSVIRAWLVH